MEAKIFVHDSAEAAEKELNNWLENNPVKLEYVGQSQSERSGRFVFIISLFYSKTEVFHKLQKA